MGKKATGKQRLDKYYRLAKEAGYRSRAAFKLAQLDQKHDFLRSSRSILDLCAAPGGWLQIAVQHAPVGSLVLGVDLDTIRPIRGVHTISEDITTPKCRSSIKRIMSDNGCPAFDCVLHDGSPNMGGKWNPEATTQASLVLEAIRLATQFLAPKGTFVSKVFRSQDYSAVIYCLKQLFEKVEVTKPLASRSTSAEIFAIGIRYKAPAKIDPRLLDMKYLFQGGSDRPKVLDVLKPTKQKRHREGYEDGNTTLWKVGLVSEFVWSETPLEFLGSVNALSFNDPACLPIKGHELTTEEIKSLCEDLYVLDKHGFKHLLKWRMRIRKELSSKKAIPKAADTEVDKKGNEEEHLLNEMEELTSALERKKKKIKKLTAKRRAKDKLRKATGMQIDATDDSYQDRELFTLSSIKGKAELASINSQELDNDHDNFEDSDSEENHASVPEESHSDMDSDEEKQRYDDQLEEMLDEAYERYLTRKGGSTKKIKRAKRLNSDDAELLEDGNAEVMVNSGHDSDKDLPNKEMNPLLVSLHEDDQPTKEQILESWFAQEGFDEAVEEADEKSDSEDEEIKPVQIPKKPEESRNPPKDASLAKTQVSQQEDFEIVPAEPIQSGDDSSSSSDESEEVDEDEKAEILAYAKKMMRKKQREHILDDAYNKYMFDDEGLPTWFVNEEKKHFQPIKPVTREEIAAMRAQFKEINARPAKKVAEAKARKKRNAMKRLEKVRHKVNSISDQPDIAERSKSKMIDQLYRKAMPKKPQKEYVVAKKGVQVRSGKGKVLVDRRMKKDARSKGMGRKGKGSSKKGKGGTKGNAKGSKSNPSPKSSSGKGARGGKTRGKMGRA